MRVSSLPTLRFDEGIVASAGAVQIERRTAVAARVVCISRAIGACADEIADEVAKELGFQRVDEEIVAQAAAVDRRPRVGRHGTERRYWGLRARSWRRAAPER